MLAVVERRVELDEPGDAREAREDVLLLERADVERGAELGGVHALERVAEPGGLVPHERHDALRAAPEDLDRLEVGDVREALRLGGRGLIDERGGCRERGRRWGGEPHG